MGRIGIKPKVSVGFVRNTFRMVRPKFSAASGKIKAGVIVSLRLLLLGILTDRIFLSAIAPVSAVYQLNFKAYNANPNGLLPAKKSWQRHNI